MPTIEITLPEGAFDAPKTEKLLTDLTRIFIKAEGLADPENSRAAANVLSFVQEKKEGTYAVGGKFPQAGSPARYLLNVTLPQHILNDERKQALVEEMTQAVLLAEGATLDAANLFRVYCVIQEIPDGNWGAYGRVVRLRDMVAAAQLDPDSTRYKELEPSLR